MSFILGLTGTIGSGKSFVSSLFSLCNAKIICADTLARDAVKPGTPALKEITAQFGDGVLHPDGSLNRQELAKIVFADPSRRRLLESIIHPVVREQELQLLEAYKDSPLVILDVPLLFETGLDKECDRTLVVCVSDETRLQRLKDSRGITREELAARLQAQMNQEQKVSRADFLIDNSSSRRHTAEQVLALLHRIFPDGLPAPLQPIPPMAFE